MKRKIGTDIDGVLLYCEEELFLEWCRNKLNWRVDLELFTRTHCWAQATGGKTGEEISPAFTHFMKIHPDIQKLVSGAYDGIKKSAW